MFDWWFRIKFWKRVVLGFVLGALAQGVAVSCI